MPTPDSTFGIGMNKPELFFYDQQSDDTEHKQRMEAAVDLARQEARARHEGMRFEWRGPFGEHQNLWDCLAYLDGEMVGSLGEIDLGADGVPWIDPYARICEAEIACEYFADKPTWG